MGDFVKCSAPTAQLILERPTECSAVKGTQVLSGLCVQVRIPKCSSIDMYRSKGVSSLSGEELVVAIQIYLIIS